MELAVIIKPEAIVHGEEILKEFDSLNSRRISETHMPFSEFLIREFYGHLASHPKQFYETMRTDLLNKPSRFYIYEGEVNDFLDAKMRIRARIMPLIAQMPNAGNYVRDGVHCSDSKDSADKETLAIKRAASALIYLALG